MFSGTRALNDLRRLESATLVQRPFPRGTSKAFALSSLPASAAFDGGQRHFVYLAVFDSHHPGIAFELGVDLPILNDDRGLPALHAQDAGWTATKLRVAGFAGDGYRTLAL